MNTPSSYQEIDALVAALEGTRPQDNPLLHIGDDNVRGGGTYLSDAVAQPKYKANEVQALAEAIRASGLQLQDGNKVYATSNPAVNEALYGAEISNNLAYDGSGFRTPRQFDRNYVAEALKAVPFAAAAWATGGALGNALPGLLGDGAIASAVGNAATNEITGAIRDAGGSDPGRLNITGNVNSQGGMQDLGETEAPGQDGWLDGLLGGRGGISVPIPGLPFPIPGNMTWEDLMDIARATGKTVQEVLESIGRDSEESGQSGEEGEQVDDGTGGLPDVPPLSVEEDEDTTPGTGVGVDDPVGQTEREDRLVLGQPTWWEGGSIPGIPAPVEVVEDPQRETPTVTPEEPSDPPTLVEGGGGAGLLLPGLIPFLVPDDNTPAPEYEMWDYVRAVDDWGIETPDYGTVEQSPLYEFASRVSQPTPVAYDRQPRRDYLNPVEEERRRRQQRGLL